VEGKWRMDSINRNHEVLTMAAATWVRFGVCVVGSVWGFCIGIGFENINVLPLDWDQKPISRYQPLDFNFCSGAKQFCLFWWNIGSVCQCQILSLYLIAYVL
jgi:hypothetical protein